MYLSETILKRVIVGGGFARLAIVLVVGVVGVAVVFAPATDLAVEFVLAVEFAPATELESVLAVAFAPATELESVLAVAFALVLVTPHFETALESVAPIEPGLVAEQDSLALEASSLYPSSSHSPKSPSAVQNAVQYAVQTRCWKRGVIAGSQSPSSLISFQINSPSVKLRDSQD